MDFKYLLLIAMLAFCSPTRAQQPVEELSVISNSPRTALGIGSKVYAAWEWHTVSLEFAHTFGRKIQVMAGPHFFLSNFHRFAAADNAFGSFLGGFVGTRIWWHATPQRGWAYFSTAELHLLNEERGASVWGPARETKILGPELGNGFGWFTEGGFYFMANFNFGAEVRLNSNIGGEVYTTLRLGTGMRF